MRNQRKIRRHYSDCHGSVKIIAQINLQTLHKMRSASQEGGVVHRLQMLHIHVLLASPLGSGNVAQPGAYQHEDGFPAPEKHFLSWVIIGITVMTAAVMGVFLKEIW